MSIKNKIRSFTPAIVLDFVGEMKMAIKTVRFYFAGIYFTYFTKVYRKNDIVLNIPIELTDFKFRGRFPLDEYEKEEREYLPKYLSANAKVLELGSCLGYISCITNKILKEKDKHVVLEANSNLIEWIEKNRDANGCGFAVENSIISHHEKNEFYIHKLIVGGSTKRETPNRVEVKGVSFSSLKKKYGVNFDTLIMDIEGGELELFREHKDSISDFNKIFFEVHPFANILTKSEAKECEDILTSIGFNNVLKDGNFQIWEKN